VENTIFKTVTTEAGLARAVTRGRIPCRIRLPRVCATPRKSRHPCIWHISNSGYAQSQVRLEAGESSIRIEIEIDIEIDSVQVCASVRLDTDTDTDFDFDFK
jgi:hypothetical protein